MTFGSSPTIFRSSGFLPFASPRAVWCYSRRAMSKLWIGVLTWVVVQATTGCQSETSSGDRPSGAGGATPRGGAGGNAGTNAPGGSGGASGQETGGDAGDGGSAPASGGSSAGSSGSSGMAGTPSGGAGGTGGTGGVTAGAGEDGAGGEPEPPPLPPELTWRLEEGDGSAIWGSGPNDIYVVGSLGTIMHSTGDGVWTFGGRDPTISMRSSAAA